MPEILSPKKDDALPKRGRPPKKEETSVEAVIMCANMWYDGKKHKKTARVNIRKEDADRFLAEDEKAGRDQRILVI